MNEIVNIIIIGGSTGFHEVTGIIEDINLKFQRYRVIGILDDNPNIQGKYIKDVKVLGFVKDAISYSESKFVFAIGSLQTQRIRSDIFESTGLKAAQFETLIHPSVIVDSSASIDDGCIIHPNVVIGHGVHIGKFVIIAVGSTLGPHVAVSDYAMITSHVLMLSNSKVGFSTFVGSMTCVVEGQSIGSYARVGIGSVVSKNIPPDVLAIGNPIRFLGKY
jgi:sugar O-acyltransferase (sialic acid O-acetyltransferase NeuD family)